VLPERLPGFPSFLRAAESALLSAHPREPWLALMQRARAEARDAVLFERDARFG
jgi:hypothetical protein